MAWRALAPDLATLSSAAAALPPRHWTGGSLGCRAVPSPAPSFRRHPLPLQVLDDSKEVGVTVDEAPGRSKSDKLVDGMTFSELCNEFECISSPYVEWTARQLARDILELRGENRNLLCFAAAVKYKDPLRRFVGRNKYKRALWATIALENPTVTVQKMAMLSTSLLIIKWTLTGQSIISRLDLTVRVESRFTMNQISGQVTEHEELWDLSASSVAAKVYFWLTRRIFADREAAYDAIDSFFASTSSDSPGSDDSEILLDMATDPTKFFQGNEEQQMTDALQVAIFVLLIYTVVQFLMDTQ